MNEIPRLHWQICRVLVGLLVLFAALGCKRLPADRTSLLASPKAAVLRVGISTNAPADLLVWLVQLDNQDYSAPQFTSLPSTNRYVIERGGGDGGIRLMSEGGRRVKEYVIPRQEIEGIVRLRYDMDVVDWTDVVMSKNTVTLIHTGYANGGIFTPSEVYVFPRFRNSFEYLKFIQTNAWATEDLRLLYPALLFYETAKGTPSRRD